MCHGISGMTILQGFALLMLNGAHEFHATTGAHRHTHRHTHTHTQHTHTHTSTTHIRTHSPLHKHTRARSALIVNSKIQLVLIIRIPV